MDKQKEESGQQSDKISQQAEAQRAQNETVKIREIHKLSGGFGPLVEVRQLWDDPHRFESWSQIVIEALFNLPRQGEVPTSTPSD